MRRSPRLRAGPRAAVLERGLEGVEHLDDAQCRRRRRCAAGRAFANAGDEVGRLGAQRLLAADRGLRASPDRAT